MPFRGLSVVLFHLFLWVLLVVSISIPIVVVVLVLLPIVILLLVLLLLLLLLLVVGGGGPLVAGPTGLCLIFCYITLWVVRILVKIFLGILLSHFPRSRGLSSLLY
jgi:hypothetical protein